MMKLTRKDFIQFNKSPYGSARTVSGINALIDVLNLPVKKIETINQEEIRKKLLELSPENDISFETEIGQSVHLHYIIYDLNLSSEIRDKFVSLCQENYKNLLQLG